jgi:hypothetical protein
MEQEYISPDALRELILAHESEVISILYLEATRRWADAHLEVAKCDGEIKKLAALKFWLETVIRSRKEPMGLVGEKGA